MARINPELFEPFVDPEKGEWIRIKKGQYENVVWRPVDIQIGEETEEGGSQVNYKIELLEGPNFVSPDPNDKQFETVCGKIIQDIFEQTAQLHEQ